jgi:hypothetical protein
MRRIITASVGLILLAGCGTSGSPKATVKGTVTYGGKPVNGCALVLYPTAEDGNSILIPVTQEGTFQTDSVPAGDYKIVIQPATVNPDMYSTTGLSPEKAAEVKQKSQSLQVKPTIPYPDKYKDRLKTDLNHTFTKGEQTLPLELKD